VPLTPLASSLKGRSNFSALWHLPYKGEKYLEEGLRI